MPTRYTRIGATLSSSPARLHAEHLQQDFPTDPLWDTEQNASSRLKFECHIASLGASTTSSVSDRHLEDSPPDTVWRTRYNCLFKSSLLRMFLKRHSHGEVRVTTGLSGRTNISVCEYVITITLVNAYVFLDFRLFPFWCCKDKINIDQPLTILMCWCTTDGKGLTVVSCLEDTKV